MSSLKDMKKELLSEVKTEDPNKLRIINEELETMELTTGLDSKNNLESFYNIWKKKKVENCTGTTNKINSWLAYHIGLTTEKPSGDFLPMRRVFARAGFPDVDTDFDDEGRDLVQKYLIDKWGRKNVANIGTYTSEKIKGCIRKVLKAVDAAYAFHKGQKEYKTENHNLAQEIAKTLDGIVLPNGSVRWYDSEGKEIFLKNVKEVSEHVPEFKAYMEKYPQVLEHASNIQGTTTIFGVHAAGLVVSDSPLEFLAPMRSSKTKGLATQFPYEDLEDIGLIKFDILSIAQLSTISECLKIIEETYEISVDIENLPLDDSKTLSLYRSGNLNGVFQCENHGMQQTMREIGVDSFDNIMAAIALYRPGPMDSIPEYVSRKKGQKPVSYFHKSLEPYVKDILEPTYGVLVYQEQIMQICSALAGFTVTDGYVMIKAIGKKKAYLMDKFEQQFISGCLNKDIPKEVAKQYWDKFITPFASYGFNACLNGNTILQDSKTFKTYTIEQLENLFSKTEESIENDLNRPEIYLSSFVDGNIVDDQVIDVFKTGEKDVYTIELDDGSIIECTLEHKFRCSDNEFRTVKDILEGEYEIAVENATCLNNV